jgi:uncharacterized RDD family membrane protein YckC
MAYQQPQFVQHQGGLPQGVSIAGIGSRIGSALLDLILVFATLYIGWLIWAAITAGTLFIGWLIWAAITAGKGQTPAKQLLKIRVVDATTGQPIGFARYFFMRGIIGNFVANIANLFTLGILFFMPLWDKRNQSVTDKVSGTLVVSDPNNAWHLA